MCILPKVNSTQVPTKNSRQRLSAGCPTQEVFPQNQLPYNNLSHPYLNQQPTHS